MQYCNTISVLAHEYAIVCAVHLVLPYTCTKQSSAYKLIRFISMALQWVHCWVLKVVRLKGMQSVQGPMLGHKATSLPASLLCLYMSSSCEITHCVLHDIFLGSYQFIGMQADQHMKKGCKSHAPEEMRTHRCTRKRIPPCRFMAAVWWSRMLQAEGSCPEY